MTIRLGGLIGFAIYLGVGALFHAVFVGPHFDWTSAWTFGWLLGWPMMLLITFWVFVFGAIVILLAVLGILMAIDNWKERRRRRAWLAQRGRS